MKIVSLFVLAIFVIAVLSNIVDAQQLTGITYSVGMDNNNGIYGAYKYVSGQQVSLPSDFNVLSFNVDLGDEVAWFNKDSVNSMNIEIYKDGKFLTDSGILSKGQYFSYIFYESGIYNVYLKGNPNLRQQIFVGFSNTNVPTPVQTSVQTPVPTTVKTPIKAYTEPAYTVNPTVNPTPVQTYKEPGCWGSSVGFGYCVGERIAGGALGALAGFGKVIYNVVHQL